jgi:hypothetical protein
MIWPRLYRHATSESLQALEACEQKALEGQPAPMRFRKMGRLLLREDYLRGELPRELQERVDATIAFATGRSPSFWKATRALARTRLVASRAEAILLKNNVRAFYVAEGLTLKVSNPGESGATARVSNEAKMRERIVPAGSIMVPETLLAGEANTSSYLLERLLEEWRPLSKAGQSFAEKLIAFQRANGVKNTEAPDVARLRAELDDALAAMALSTPRDVAQVLDQIIRNDISPEPWSLCHGDLSRTNIFEREGICAIIDWEFAGYGPCAMDAVRLSTQFPEFSKYYLAGMEHRDARAWLLLACARSILEHRKRWAGLADNRHGAAIRRKTARKAREILGLASRL